jgi:phage shock protein A
MSLFDRLGRLVRANVNDAVSKAEDPAKILEQSVMDMQDNFVKMKEAVAQSIANQRRIEQQYKNNQKEADTWQQRAQLALQKGDENLAREALVRKKSFADTAAALKAQYDQQTGQVDGLKKQLMAVEAKIVDAKNKKDMLKARDQAARANVQLQSSVNSMSNSSAMAAFERMEDKVLQMEARGQASAELAGANLEMQFAELAAGGQVDDELAAMKQQMLGSSAASQPQIAATPQDAPPVPVDAKPNSQAIDAELEALKTKMDNL